MLDSYYNLQLIIVTFCYEADYANDENKDAERKEVAERLEEWGRDVVQSAEMRGAESSLKTFDMAQKDINNTTWVISWASRTMKKMVRNLSYPEHVADSTAGEVHHGAKER
jgi:hypothetical protein